MREGGREGGTRREGGRDGGRERPVACEISYLRLRQGVVQTVQNK